ncbi:unnamed protein product [Cuscuta campestris]|uniref:Uncharacterized protein n=1 Tax=Cuscuta campestris TaxID=132261 RepID=A0A484LCI5_9ASTE|nr:unnamed protein product [Cuscuta campestris]
MRERETPPTGDEIGMADGDGLNIVNDGETEGQEGRVGSIFIPTGPNSEGIFLLVKAITDAINLRGDNAYIPREERVDKEQKGFEEPSSMLNMYGKKVETTEEGITKKGEDMEMRKPSISSELLDLDIQEANMVGDGSDKGQKQQQEGSEEDQTEKLFLPVFQAYFDALFKAAENQIKEALAKKELLDNLKKGLLPNQHGKALRATRETIRSMDMVTMVNFEGAKYPVFISYSNADKETVAEFLSGEPQEN